MSQCECRLGCRGKLSRNGGVRRVRRLMVCAVRTNPLVTVRSLPAPCSILAVHAQIHTGHPQTGRGARTPEFDSSWILGCARSQRDSVCLPNPVGPACTAGTSVGVGGPSNGTGRGSETGGPHPVWGPHVLRSLPG